MPVAGIVQRLTRGIRYALTGNADWFGPGQPVPPGAPAAVEGRQFQMPISTNTLIQTKTEGIGFGTLRMMADSTDIIRLLIEERKDQLCALDWTIHKKGDDIRGRGKPVQDAKSHAIETFLCSPDQSQPWHSWLRMLLEDMYVLDAASLYVQRTKGGKLYALRPIDGATIKRVIDGHGWTPAPPLPAYQQILNGIAASDYTTEDLLYLPRNVRANRIYGLSHVEQIIVLAKTWLARQASNLEYYDKGSVPDGFLSASKDWGAQEIARYQELFDMQLSGQLGERRKIKITPNDSKFVATKEPALKSDYDEWLVRIACFCFSVPPIPFIKEMTRATADQSASQSQSGGLEFDRRWVERVVNSIIATQLESPEYEFSFQDRESSDPLERAQIDQIYVTAGVLLPDEVRGDLGLAPLPKIEADPNATPNGQPPKPGQQKPGQQQDDGAEPPKEAAAHDHLHKAAPMSKDMRTLAGAFEQAFDLIRQEALKAARGFGKAAGGDGSQHTPENDHKWLVLADGLDTSPLSLVWDDLTGTLKAVSAKGASAEILRIIADGEITRPEAQELVGVTGSETFDFMNYRDPNAVLWAEKHAAELLTRDGAGGELADATRNMIRRTLVKAVAGGLTDTQIAALLEQDYAFSRDRAELIARTEVQNAAGSGAYEGAQRVGMKVKKWLTSNNDNACPLCLANEAAGWIAIDKAFPAGAEAPLQHPRCFPGSTTVAFASRPVAAIDRPFNGRVVVLRTASGQEVTCTPNHPILTDCGWVAAQTLDVGSNVVRYVGANLDTGLIDFSDLNHKHVPPSIQEVTDALGRSQDVTATPVPVSPEDFHGDGEGSDVAIVRTDRKLRDAVDPTVPQQSDEDVFVRAADRIPCADAGLHMQLASTCDAPAGRRMSLSDLGDALFGSHASPSNRLSVTASANTDAVTGQELVQRAAADAEPPLGSEQAFASLIAFDEVTEILVKDFVGHVYNLETAEGWYVAGGIVAHNCQCDASYRRKAPN